MTDDTPTELPPDQRAAFYLAEKVSQLRAEVEAAEARVNAGFGAEVLPVFRMTTTDWLEVLRADRLVFDQLQFLLDPEAAEGLAEAAKRKTDPPYWLPGAALPSRGPDLGAAVGD